MGPFSLLHRSAGFSALCRLRHRSYVVASTQHAPGHSGFAWTSRRRCLGQQAVNTPEISEGSTFSNFREVIMTITSKAALHHSSDANGSQVSKSGIQACDFIHR